MDDLNEKILDILRKNSRLSTKSIASTLKSSRQTIEYRMKKMQNDGIIKKYTIEESNKENTSSAIFMIKLRNRPAVDAVNSISSIKGVDRLVSISGEYDLMATVVARSNEEIGDINFLVSEIENVSSVMTFIVIKGHK